MTADTMARKLNLSVKTVYQRLKNKGVYQKGYAYDYDHEVYLEICHEKYSEIKRKKVCQTKADLDIIHYYFNNKDNRISVIAKELNEPIARVNYVITKFLQSGEIIIESKINNL